MQLCFYNKIKQRGPPNGNALYSLELAHQCKIPIIETTFGSITNYKCDVPLFLDIPNLEL